MSRDLLMYTIYQGEPDAPAPFVVKQWQVTDQPIAIATGIQFSEPSLEAARNRIPLGLACRPADPCDATDVIETWF